MIPERFKSILLQAALYGSVATIPLSNQSNSIALIFFVAACLIQHPPVESKERLAKSKLWLIPVIYFFWTVSSYFWDTSGGFTIKEIERYSILLFIPPAMALLPVIPARIIKRACILFIGVTMVVCIACLIKATLEYRITGDYRVFFYQYLGEQMKLNAIFLSNYCLASITWLLYYGFVDKGEKSRTNYLLVILSTAFLLLMIFMLSSKLIIALTLLIIFIFIIGLSYIRGYLLRGLMIVSVVIIAGLFAVNQFSYLRWRINVTEVKMYRGQQDDQNGIAIRLFMWQTTANLIAEKPILGYGLKGGRLTLLDSYRQKGFDLGVSANYHSHNQYLESALMAGIPATILLVIFIFFALRQAIMRKNFLLLLMISHFMIQSLFEATFEVQHELVFYIFFIFLFYYHAPDFKRIADK